MEINTHSKLFYGIVCMGIHKFAYQFAYYVTCVLRKCYLKEFNRQTMIWNLLKTSLFIL